MKWVKKVFIAILLILTISYAFALSWTAVFFQEPSGPPAWQEWEDAYGHQPIIK